MAICIVHCFLRYQLMNKGLPGIYRTSIRSCMTLLCHNHGITGMKGARVSGNLSSNKMSYQTVRMD